MQIWPLLDNGLQRAREIHAETLIYDDKATLLAALLDARDDIDAEFQLPTDTRNYWTIRNSLTELVAVAALYAEDGNHGQDPTLNPTTPLALNTAGQHATDQDDPLHPYAHWEDFKTDLDIIRNALDTAIDPNPNLRDPETILELLADNAGKAALFGARARLGIHDKDPHAQTNFAVIQWQDPDWNVLANYCDYGYLPDIPTEPGDFPDETRCLPCVLPQGFRALRQPQPTPQDAPVPKSKPAIPYHARPRYTRERGVITGATALHWPVLAAMALSTNQHALPLAIADHGLTERQRSNLKRFSVLWLDAPQPHIPDTTPPHHAIAAPKAWTKPWLCHASPFERSLWIDADAIPLLTTLEPLDPQNELASIATNRTWNADSTYLYRDLIKALDPTGPQPHPGDYCVNANSGILCWTKGDPLITSWKNHAQLLINHPHLTALCGVRDQSALYLAMRTQLLRTGRKVPYLPDSWNWPADDLPAPEAKNRRPIPLDPRQLLETTRQRHPAARVVHWLGYPKPQHLYVSE